MRAADLRWKFSVLRHTVKHLRHRIPTARLCNICGFEGFFDPFGWPVRPEARCPSCSSVERHREFKAWLDTTPNVFVGRDVLHFAPEKTLRNLVEAGAASYVSADLRPYCADLTLNIEKLDLADASFGAVICSHVLEHVDDRKALAEIYRILRPGGLAIIMVPVIEGWKTTYENASVATEGERRLHFDQRDHVRYFGADVRDRIRAAGFALSEYTAEEPYVSRHALARGSKVFIASR